MGEESFRWAGEQQPRPVGPAEAPRLLEIINAAAKAYRGTIPADCWHQPYITAAALNVELHAGVAFSGIDVGGELVAIMGVQHVRNVRLIRHAYVLPTNQGSGLGGRLIDQICSTSDGQILVGTWRAATWAIGFYERHGFESVAASSIPILLRTYWTISDRQIETSVVLARPALDEKAVKALVADAAA